MAELANGYEAVPLKHQFVLRRWVRGLPHDIERFPFSPTLSGDRKRAFDRLYKRFEQLNTEAAAAAKEDHHGI